MMILDYLFFLKLGKDESYKTKLSILEWPFGLYAISSVVLPFMISVRMQEWQVYLVIGIWFFIVCQLYWYLRISGTSRKSNTEVKK